MSGIEISNSTHSLELKIMGEVKKTSKVKLFIGMIAVNKLVCAEAEEHLIKKFGKIDYRSQVLPFKYTDYYEKEMGRDIIRQFISFKRLIDPAKLSAIKLFTNDLELKISSPNRKINLDPGYLTGSKMVLATTKDFSHRIYLQKGIYAEVTLRFRNHTFTPLDYTYPDYATDYIPIFNQIREIYLNSIVKNPSNVL